PQTPVILSAAKDLPSPLQAGPSLRSGRQWIATHAGRKPFEVAPPQHFSYFQFRRLPSAIHSMACASRFARVSSRFASTIHSTYSRLQLGGKASNVAFAALFFSSATARSSGTSGGGFGVDLRAGAFTPPSLSFIALRTCASRVRFGGRSCTEASLP